MSDGRWPANVILSPDMARALDLQSGYQRDGVAVSRNKDTSDDMGGYSGGWRKDPKDATYGGGGGASRFFLSAWYEPDELAWIYANGLRPYTGQE